MKVYDCFTFFNEFELLELRLKSLYDVVDYFVIIEADKTFNNDPKPCYFQENKDKFAEFLPKIRHFIVKIDIPYKGTGDWSLEYAQRNAISHGLKDAAPDDLVFISDLDEIWTPDILQKINNRQVTLMANYTPPLAMQRVVVPCRIMVHAVNLLEFCPIAVKQEQYYYYMNLLDTNLHWPGTIIVKFKNLTTPQNLRNHRYALPYILNGGWHFSWMGGTDRIIKKMNSIVDGFEAVENGTFLTKKEDIEAVMNAGVFLDKKPKDFDKLTDNQKFQLRDISHINLPYIQEFVKKYPHFLKPKD